MNSIRLYFIPFLVAFGSVQAVAQETVEEVTGNPSNAVMAADVGSGVTGSMEDYLQNKGWRLGRYDSNPSGGYIGWGRAPIRTTPSDKRYGRARTIAYTEAYTNAMAEFAGAMSKEILSDTMVTVFSDEQGASRIQAQSTDSLFRALSDRLSELSIAALDRGLERLGADPQRLRQYSRREKQIVSEQLVTRKMQIESAARLRGVRTLSSFEDRDDAGVLIIHHPRLEQIADRLMADAAARPKSGDVEPILSKVDALSETDLIFQFGVRVIPDSEGIPVILSFGQSSPAVTNSDSDRSIRMAVTSSRTVAEARADAAIAEFVNSTVFAANKPVVVGGEEIGIEMDGRQSTRYESAEFFEDANSMISQTARAEIAGVTTIRRWQANHPDTGHLYVGVVRMWTPSQNYEYGGRLPDAPPSEDASADEDGSAEDEEVSDKIRQSKDLMDGDW